MFFATMQNRVQCFAALLLSTFVVISFGLSSHAQQHPNILLINVDDMGYGDGGFNNEDSLIRTPHLDALASRGRVFTQAYTSSAICGPSRYALLTGRHTWRTGLTSGNSPALGQMTIDKDRLTLGSLLKNHGYDTAMIGKWGVRFDFRGAAPNFSPSSPSSTPSRSQIDLTRPILGPELVGFEYTRNAIWFGNGHAWAENGALDDTTQLSIINYTRRLEFEVDAAVGYLHAKGAQLAGQGNGDSKFKLTPEAPFFMYFATGAPHTPITPMAAFNTSPIGIYGDFLEDLDNSIGLILKALEDAGLADDTLVIFTSDNGAEVSSSEGPDANSYLRALNQDHRSMGPLRGGKRSLHEAGTRVPFIAAWPGKIPADTSSDQVISQTDMLATFAEIVGYELPDNAGEDSISVLAAMTGNDPPTSRDLVLHAGASNQYALRSGNWSFIDVTSYRSPSEPDEMRTLLGVLGNDNGFGGSLYSLASDLRQTENLYAQEVLKRNELHDTLDNYKRRDHTAPSRLRLLQESFEDPILYVTNHNDETEVGGVAPGWVGYSNASSIGGFFNGGLGGNTSHLSLLHETRVNAPGTPLGSQWQVLKTSPDSTLTQAGRNLGDLQRVIEAAEARAGIELTFKLSARRAQLRSDIYDIAVDLYIGDRDQWHLNSVPQSLVLACASDAPTLGKSVAASFLVNNEDSARLASMTVDASSEGELKSEDEDGVYLDEIRVLFQASDFDFSYPYGSDFWLVFTQLGTGSTTNSSGQTLIDDVSLRVFLPGDVNGDGAANGLDVQPFIQLVLGGGYSAEADLNLDGRVNGLDVQPFINVILGQ